MPSPTKPLKQRSDLSIAGQSPPAFASPIHVGEPQVPDRAAFLEKMNDILDRNWLTNDGPMVKAFESELVSRMQVDHCVAICNGTLALEIAIRALELTGEVIVPAWTFVATAHAAFWQGLTPVFADIDADTQNLDPDSVQRMITPRTTGIIAVHMWGRAAPAAALETIARERGLKLIFDAAHAFGCRDGDRPVGSRGDCEVFSFHATKSFHTMEGGAVTTNDAALADRMRLIRNFGFKGYDNVVFPGTNGKMIEACAAMGLANLPHHSTIVAGARARHMLYRARLERSDVARVVAYPEDGSNNHHYLVLQLAPTFSRFRDAIVEALQAENIIARKYFWPGVHRMAPYRDLFPRAGLLLPVTEDIAARTIVLPNGPSVDAAVVDAIVDVIELVANG